MTERAPWRPRKGDRVFLPDYKGRPCGTVLAAGPEQSEVRLDGGRPLIYVNGELRPCAPRMSKPRRTSWRD